MNSELISIIVPVYQVEKYINTCIQSLVDQTYTNLEILLIDDGSEDACPEICDNWQKKDPRIRVFHKKNEGLSRARNEGLNQARGEYILFVDSDDYIHPRLCEIVIPQMKKADLCIYAQHKFVQEEKIQENIDVKFSAYSINQAYYQMYAKDQDYMNKVNNKMFHRKLFEHLRFPENVYFEDAAIMPSILEQNPKIYVSEQELYYYRQREEGIMGDFQRNFSLKKSRDCLDYLKDRVDRYEKIEDRKLYSIMCAHYYQNIIVTYSRYKRNNVSIEELKSLHQEFKDSYKTRKNVSFDWKKKIKYTLFYYVRDFLTYFIK
ncbi:MAG: glycosyltransferase family 2 protein [Firmicutes bacterium]|nr:glycosyltransferase family 2 protein [Bacillota bacterium]